MAAGEAVTLQLGPYAGCVGSHWWGLQVGGGRRTGGGTGRDREGARRSPARRPPQAAAPRGSAELGSGALLRAAGGREESRTPRLIALELKGSAGRAGTG